MRELKRTRSRLRFDAIDTNSTPDGRWNACVRLEWDGEGYEGAAEGLQTEHGMINAAARAALDAALEAASGAVQLEIVGLKAIRAFDGWVVVSRLVGSTPEGEYQLLGAAPCETAEELPDAAVRALLHASNRVLSWGLLTGIDRGAG